MASGEAASRRERDEAPVIGALIRARRRQMSMTLKQLGLSAGLSVSFLSQVERGHATPSLGALAGIARGLGVEMDYLVASPAIESGLTRHAERRAFSVRGSDVVYERLTTQFPGQVLSGFFIEIPPQHRSEIVRQEGEELVVVLAGALTISVDDETMTLKTGDSLHFQASRRHHWSNDGGTPARVLWVGTVPVFGPST